MVAACLALMSLMAWKRWLDSTLRQLSVQLKYGRNATVSRGFPLIALIAWGPSYTVIHSLQRLSMILSDQPFKERANAEGIASWANLHVTPSPESIFTTYSRYESQCLHKLTFVYDFQFSDCLSFIEALVFDLWRKSERKQTDRSRHWAETNS